MNSEVPKGHAMLNHIGKQEPTARNEKKSDTVKRYVLICQKMGGNRGSRKQVITDLISPLDVILSFVYFKGDKATCSSAICKIFSSG